MDGNGMNLRRTPAQESEIAKRRQRQTIRVSRIANGYLLTQGDSGESSAAYDRREMHAQVDAFFDRLATIDDEPDQALPAFRPLAAAC